MKKILLCIAFITTAALSALAADDAAKVIADAAAKLHGAKSVTATCKITSPAGTENATLVMSGTKFFVKAPQTEIWYDGSTLWSYSRSTNEITLSEPSQEELSEINPLSVMEYFTSTYTASMLAPSAGKKNIKLTADKSSRGIASAEVSLNATTLAPSAVTLLLSNGQKIGIAISSLKFGGTLPESTFTFRMTCHPSAVLVDLR